MLNTNVYSTVSKQSTYGDNVTASCQMSTWIKYFIGTPKRFVYTGTVVSLVVVTLNPQILTTAVNALILALAPLLGPALAILIVFTGIKTILKK